MGLNRLESDLKYKRKNEIDQFSVTFFKQSHGEL